MVVKRVIWALKNGTVEISLRNAFGNIVVGTLDVLFVPSYPQNIFSVDVATANGANVNFLPDSAQLVTGSGQLFHIKKHGIQANLHWTPLT